MPTKIVKERHSVKKQEILDRLRFELELRNRSETTTKDYIRRVKCFQDYFDRPADQLREAEISEYLHYLLHGKQISPASVNTYNSSIRFLYAYTLDIDLNLKKIPRIKTLRSIPELPDKRELQKIFDCAPSPMYKAIFMTIYGSGLRVSEAANLRIQDIDSKSMRIFVNQGKGGKDRFTLLPTATLNILREYYKQYRPKEWLFRTRNGNKMSAKSIQNAFKSAVEKNGTKKHITVHTLRACFATHLLESGVNLVIIKQLLGHVKLDTTAWYMGLADSEVFKTKSPLDSMPQKRGRKPKEDSTNA